ncbi:preprotein translocase subunit SecE [Zafaria sp. Z1313]|uniref:preprotein translocase subunit SecE n=1 Tax=unclassified Zafaria TaxID=2828765 RepID=UPI002E75D498|nr:preprotein translocase subunit SecE [Zafaria sp. J156]MEE1620584.1 preprotein translocase subunit SecE [Zafaria sp. J156]
MTETAAGEPQGAPRDRKGAKDKGGFFARIFLFFRQVVAELKKVVTPTRSELVNYTLMVLGFVIVVMLIVTALDFVFGQGSIFVFTNPPEQ